MATRTAIEEKKGDDINENGEGGAKRVRRRVEVLTGPF